MVVDTDTDTEMTAEGLADEIVGRLHSRPDTTLAMVRELVDEGVTLEAIRSHLETAPLSERGMPWDFAKRVRQSAHQLTLVGTDSKVAPFLERQMARVVERDACARAGAVPMPTELRRGRAEG